MFIAWTSFRNGFTIDHCWIPNGHFRQNMLFLNYLVYALYSQYYINWMAKLNMSICKLHFHYINVGYKRLFIAWYHDEILESEVSAKFK